VLWLSDDPLVLMNINEPERIGTYSTIATAGEQPLSLWDDSTKVIDRAAEAMRGHHLIVMPVTPRDLLTLSPTTLLKPGRYDAPDELAANYNAVLAASSSRWTAHLPEDPADAPAPERIEMIRLLGREVEKARATAHLERRAPPANRAA
jgi:hypothetical protein